MKKRCQFKLTKESINSIEAVKHDAVSLVGVCSDEEIILASLLSSATSTTKTSTQQVLFKNGVELSALRSIANGSLLLASDATKLHVFDLAGGSGGKPTSTYKFSKDSINTLDTNASGTLVATGDDTGDIKLIDLRCPNAPSAAAAAVTLRLNTTLRRHTNVCFTVRFNPLNEHELISGSYDCSVLKWDVRTSSSSYAQKIDIADVLARHSSPNDELYSTMTPAFVHCTQIATGCRPHQPLLLCGVETGMCLAFDLATFAYVSHRQLETLNCALTQIEPTPDPEVFATGGNGGHIRLMRIDDDPTATTMATKDDVAATVAHGAKLNCMRRLGAASLLVADTSNRLTLYEFN